MKQTIFRVFVAGGSVTISGSVTIAFPTALIAQPETTNNTIVVGPGAAANVLAANANRTGAIIVNNTGNLLRIRIGGPAVATDLEFPNGTVYVIEPSTIGQIPQGLVSVFNPTGGALNVSVQEF